MATLAPRAQLASAPLSHSVMEDASDTESDPDLDAHLDFDQQQFYRRQQEQALYYQQHQQQHGSSSDLSSLRATNIKRERNINDEDDDEMYSDDESSTASIPDENINFELTYALHTFSATVEGQASVVKGDSLVLLDDVNTYWWLVRVLKTEEIGYIPAENIETPYERLARLNKHRNVDLAAATTVEKQLGPGNAPQARERMRGMLGNKTKIRTEKVRSSEDSGNRHVIFAPPTYVEHPGVTWSTDGEDSGEEADEDYEGSDLENEVEGHEGREGSYEGDEIDRSLDDDRMEMEPDDGVEWADSVAREDQRQIVENKPGSNNPFVQRHQDQTQNTSTPSVQAPIPATSGSVQSPQAADTRRITVTPSVAQEKPVVLLPSAMQSITNGRNLSGQSLSSVTSVVSSASSARSGTPTSPNADDGSKKSKKMKKSSKEDLGDGEKRRSKGMLSGLFSRNKDKNKKGISSSDPRVSEDSTGSGGAESTSTGGARRSEDDGRQNIRQQSAQEQPQVSHSYRLQQRDQAIQQAYSNKYLTKSPSGEVRPATTSEAAAIAQQATNAARYASMNAPGSKRPSSIILSPNPAGPPLLNVMRVFAGDHVKSEASFKTVLLNETTTASDLIRQLQQRFRLHGASSDAGYYLTIKDVSGEELELEANERPLEAFQEAVQRWTANDEEPDFVLRAITPTIKRSSISSISSIASLSAHPAIAKLGMNDFSDDSTVKIYLNRRRPSSMQINLPDTMSVSSSYSTQLSAVQEHSAKTDSGEWSVAVTPPRGMPTASGSSTPPTPQPRYNPSLTVSTSGQVSPERYSSPSAKFTVQLVIHPEDLPDGSTFDPVSEGIIPQMSGSKSGGNAALSHLRKRLFALPKNATVVEAIEQGLERFGIQEGMVDGGDDVDEKQGPRRNIPRVRYSLAAAINDQERTLLPASKVLEAYAVPPQLKPVEKIPHDQRRRSRDVTSNSGSLSDILPTDPVFVLRRVHPRPPAPGVLQRQQAELPSSDSLAGERSPMSPQEIIAAQRAATRANQKALISAHANAAQGIDVVVPDKGTFRSSRLLEPHGEVVRYSYIDGDGETYDISEILEEEWGSDGSKASPTLEAPSMLEAPPTLTRTTTDSSVYVTAPSTPVPDEERTLDRPRSQDILQGVLRRSRGQPDDKLEEKLTRVISKVKSGSVRQTPIEGRTTPTGRITPQGRSSEVMRNADGSTDATPRASSRQADLTQTAATVNRIVSKHRQQPSIASIMSDFSTSPAPESYREPSSSTRTSEMADEETGVSTPLTTMSSSHPTPPFNGTAIFTRSVSVASPTPHAPVKYQDDFGIKSLMAIVDVRSRVAKPEIVIDCDEVEKTFYGQRVGWDGVQADVKGIFGGVMEKLNKFDRDIDELLAELLVTRPKRTVSESEEQ